MRNKPRPSHFAILVGAFLVFAILVSSAISIWVARQQSIDEWRQQLSNLSLVMAEQTAQEVAAAYLILDSIAESAQAAEVRSAADLSRKMATAEVYRSLRDKKRALPQIDVATIVARNGDVVNFTRSHPAPPINLADRDYFQAHLRDPHLGVFISKPVRNKGNQQWTFYLSRRLNDAQGEFIGLALVGLSSSFLSDFYQKISLGAGASITLYRRDFTVLARWPRADALMGEVNLTGASHQVIEGLKKNSDVLLSSGPRFAEGGRAIYRMGAPRLIEPYPLIITITVTEDLFLAQWRRFALIIALLAGCSTVAIVIALALLVKSLKRRESDMALTERLKSEAEAANHAKSEFLAMMSHEIRTPLTSIIGFAEMLDGRPEPGVCAEAGQIILRNGRHLLSIINDILDISKIEAGRLQIEQLAFSPLEIVMEIDSMMSAQARSKGIGFRLEYAFPLPAQVLGDPTRWKQILFNLCGNAIKFTELGEVVLALSYDAARAQLCCGVSDTGVGISAQQMAGLFQPFAQADGATARKYGGTGLGLHLAQQLARKMGGRVGASSELGRGSRFDAVIVAPAAPGAAWLECAPQPLAEALAMPDPGVGSLRGRVLLAEDGPDNRKLVGAFLSRLGLDWVAVENGAQAVEQALAGEFDLILMDVQMPVLDGVQATRTLRAAGCAVPIVALTANVMAEDVRRYLQSGCTDCVGKPIDFKRLWQCLAALLPEQSDDTPDLFDTEQLPGFAEIRQAFEQGLPSQLAQLGAAAAGARWDEAARLAHALKGSAGSFGYPRLTEAARATEDALRGGDTARAAALVAQLAQLDELAGLAGAPPPPQ